MSTVADAAYVPVWKRVGQALGNWGKKVATPIKKVGRWIGSAATWVWNLSAVQWVATKSWAVVRGPVGKGLAVIGGIIGAVIFAPKAVAVLLLIVLAFVVLTAVFVYLIYRHVKKIDSPEGWERFTDTVADVVSDRWEEAKEEVRQEVSEDSSAVEYNGTPEPDETINARMAFLDQELTKASERKDDGAVSELTGRLYLLEVRWGKHQHLKANATVSAIHRECRKENEERFGTQMSDFTWDWQRMFQSIRSEDKRLKDISKMQEKSKQKAS